MTGAAPDEPMGAARGGGRGREGDRVEEPPPILGSWRRLYGFVIASLLLWIALCGWLTRLGR